MNDAEKLRLYEIALAQISVQTFTDGLGDEWLSQSAIIARDVLQRTGAMQGNPKR